MTNAERNSRIRSALRKLWLTWPTRTAKLKQGRKVVTGQRHRFEQQCEECREWFPQKDVDVDHIVPAGSVDDLNGFTDRLLVDHLSDLQILCKPCHKVKTQAENAARRKKK